MKTVIDAVNEFKGVWPYPSDNHMTQLHEVGSFEVAVDDFNQCVDEMATNYGTSETYSDYKVNFEMINDDMKPVTVPTFTQEMYDADIIPAIGMEVLFNSNPDIDFKFDWNDGDKIKCVSHSTDAKGYAIGVFRHELGVTVSLVTCLIKPLTPPKTDTEKAIDDLNGVSFRNYLFGSLQESLGYHRINDDQQEYIEDIISKIMGNYPSITLEQIKAGKIHGVTFTGES